MINYLKNVGRSFKYALPSIAKELIPVAFNTYDANASDITNIFSDIKKASQRSGSFLKKLIPDEDVANALEQTWKNAKSDLKSGKIYNKDRTSMGGDFDLGGIDGSAFEDLDNWTPEGSNMPKGTSNVSESESSNGLSYNKEINATTNNYRVSRTEVKPVTNNFVVSGGGGNSAANTRALGRIHMAIGQQTLAADRAIHSTLNQMMQYNIDQVSAFHQQSVMYYGVSTGLMSEIAGSLKTFSDRMEEVYSAAADLNEEASEVINDMGVFSLKGYIKNVTKNFEDVTMGMFSKDIWGPMLQDYVANPLGEIMGSAIKASLPIAFKDAMGDLNKTLSGIPAAMFLKLNAWAADDNNPFISLMGKLLGVHNSVRGADLAVAYKKGPIPFDGETKRAIVSAIPSYLAKILGAIKSQKTYDPTKDGDHLIFDSSTGRMESKDAIKKSIKEQSDSVGSITRRTNDIMSSLSDQLGDIAEEDREALRADFTTYLKALGMRGKEYKGTKTGFSGVEAGTSEETAKIIGQYFDQAGASEKFEFAKDIQKYISEQNRFQRDLEKKVYSKEHMALDDEDVDITKATRITSANRENPDISGCIGVTNCPGTVLKVTLVNAEGLPVAMPIDRSRPGRRRPTTGSPILNPTDPIDTSSLPTNEANSDRAGRILGGKDLSSIKFESVMSYDLLKEKRKKEAAQKLTDDPDSEKGILASIKRLFEKPFNWLAEKMDKFNNTMAELFFGDAQEDDKSKGPVWRMFNNFKSRISKMVDDIKGFFVGDKETGKKGIFSHVSSFIGEKIIDPLRVKFFGTDDKDGKNDGKGLFSVVKQAFMDKIIDPIKNHLTLVIMPYINQAWQGFKDWFIGSKDKKGEYAGGLISGMINKSKDLFLNLNTKIFGGVDKKGKNDGKGWLSPETQATIKKFGKGAMGGVVGSSLFSMLLFPVNPWIGSLLGMAYQTKTAQKWLYGEDGKSGIVGKFKEKFKEMTGKVDTYLFGEKDAKGHRTKVGVLTNTINLFRAKFDILRDKATKFLYGSKDASTEFLKQGLFPWVKEKWGVLVNNTKTYLFGDVDPDTGKRKGGVFGELRKVGNYIWTHVKAEFTKDWENVKNFWTKEIVKPMKAAFEPFITEFKIQFQMFKKWGKDVFVKGLAHVKDAINDTFKNIFGKSLSEMMIEYVVKPIQSTLDTVKNLIGNVFKQILLFPVNIIKKAAEGFSKKQGYALEKEKTADEKAKHGVIGNVVEGMKGWWFRTNNKDYVNAAREVMSSNPIKDAEKSKEDELREKYNKESLDRGNKAIDDAKKRGRKKSSEPTERQKRAQQKKAEKALNNSAKPSSIDPAVASQPLSEGTGQATNSKLDSVTKNTADIAEKTKDVAAKIKLSGDKVASLIQENLTGASTWLKGIFDKINVIAPKGKGPSKTSIGNTDTSVSDDSSQNKNRKSKGKTILSSKLNMDPVVENTAKSNFLLASILTEVSAINLAMSSMGWGWIFGKGGGGGKKSGGDKKKGFFGTIIDTITAPFKFVGNFFKNTFKAVGHAVKEFAKGVGNVILEVAKFPLKLISGLWKGLKFVGQIILKSVQKIGEAALFIGGQIVKGIGWAIKTTFELVGSAAKLIGDTIKGVFESVTKIAGMVLEAGFNLVKSIGEATGKILEFAFKSIPLVIEGIGKLAEGIVNATSAVLKFTGNLIISAAKVVGSFLNLFNPFKKKGSGVGKSSLIQQVWIAGINPGVVFPTTPGPKIRGNSGNNSSNAQPSADNPNGFAAFQSNMKEKMEAFKERIFKNRSVEAAEKTAKNTTDIVSSGKKVWQWLLTIGAALAPLLASLKEWLMGTKLAKAIGSAVANASRFLSGGIGGIGTKIGNAAGRGWGKLKNLAGKGVTALKDKVKAGFDAAQNIYSTGKTVAEDFGGNLKSMGSGLVTKFGAGNLMKAGAGAAGIAAFAATTYSDYQGAQKRGEKGLKMVGSTLIGNAGDTMGSLLANAGKQALKYGGLGLAIGSFFPGVGNLIGAGIGGAFGLISGLFGSDPAKSWGVLKKAFSKVGMAIKKMWNIAVEKVGEAVNFLKDHAGEIFKAFFNPIGTLLNAFTKSEGEQTFIEKAIGKAGKFIFKMFDKILGGFPSKIVEALGNFFTKNPFGKAIYGAFLFIRDGLDKISEIGWTVFKWIGKTLWAGIKWYFSTLIKGFKLFGHGVVTAFKFIVNIGKGIWNGIKAVGKFIVGGINWLGSTIGGFLKWVGSGISKGLSAVKKVFTTVGGWIVDGFNLLKKTFGYVIDPVIQAFAWLGKQLKKVIDPVVDMLTKVWTAVTKGFKIAGDVLNTIGKGIAALFGKGTNFVGNIVKGVTDTLHNKADEEIAKHKEENDLKQSKIVGADTSNLKAPKVTKFSGSYEGSGSEEDGETSSESGGLSNVTRNSSSSNSNSKSGFGDDVSDIGNSMKNTADDIGDKVASTITQKLDGDLAEGGSSGSASGGSLYDTFVRALSMFFTPLAGGSSMSGSSTTGAPIAGTTSLSGSSSGWKVGNLTAKYESGGNAGTISKAGNGDAGGVSYGKYQFARGTIPAFLTWLSTRNPGYYQTLSAGGAPGSPGFNAAWTSLYGMDPKGFEQAQDAYAKVTFYDPISGKLQKAVGINIEGRSDAVKAVALSTAIQHGNAQGIFKAAGIKQGMSDEEIIKRVYAERGRAGKNGKLAHFGSSSVGISKGVAKRYVNEQADALAMLGGSSSSGETSGVASSISMPGTITNTPTLDKSSIPLTGGKLPGHNAAILKTALEMEQTRSNLKYFYGGDGSKNSPGIDCSHFVSQSLEKATNGEFRGYLTSAGFDKDKRFENIPHSQKVPGDILTYPNKHVMIYLGDGKVVDSSSEGKGKEGKGIRIRNRGEKYISTYNVKRFKGGIGGVWNGIKNAGSAVVKGVGNAAKSVGNWFSSMFGDIKKGKEEEAKLATTISSNEGSRSSIPNIYSNNPTLETASETTSGVKASISGLGTAISAPKLSSSSSISSPYIKLQVPTPSSSANMVTQDKKFESTNILAMGTGSTPKSSDPTSILIDLLQKIEINTKVMSEKDFSVSIKNDNASQTNDGSSNNSKSTNLFVNTPSPVQEQNNMTNASIRPNIMTVARGR